MNKISLTASMRSNLLSLQNISRQVDSTQNKLSTGNKVNSAIDNPSSYYAARSLNNRAGDLDALLDSMGQAVSTIKAATTALETGASFLEQAAAVATQVLEGTGGVGGGSGTGSNGGTGDVGEGGGVEGGGDKPSPEPIYIPQASGISDSASIRNTSIFDGRANTKAMIDQIGADALAATACNQFYAPGVDKNDANFGQGQWYLPAVGELMEMYGTDASGITGGYDTSGMNGDNKSKIDAAFSAINAVDGKATNLTSEYYWSSTEYYDTSSWLLNMKDGYRHDLHKSERLHYVRSFLYLENKFNPKDAASAPKIGDVMYSDLTYGSADDYDGSKTAVGIVNWVSEDGKSAKIVNLKDLTFSSVGDVGGFNSADPYGNNEGYSYHTSIAQTNVNIAAIDNFKHDQLLSAFQEAVAESAAKTPAAAMTLADDVPVDETPPETIKYDSSQYKSILSQYDALIKDASYKGVNLLQQQDLKVTFNESRTSSLNVVGKDASSAALGLVTTEWKSIQDIAQSLKEISSALNKIRSMSSELGSYYNIVTTRQDFTEKLINVLEEGADKLTLADMNEESANMLALQTRQQLAVNSLSLASQAAQSILKLF